MLLHAIQAISNNKDLKDLKQIGEVTERDDYIIIENNDEMAKIDKNTGKVLDYIIF